MVSWQTPTPKVKVTKWYEEGGLDGGCWRLVVERKEVQSVDIYPQEFSSWAFFLPLPTWPQASLILQAGTKLEAIAEFIEQIAS